MNREEARGFLNNPKAMAANGISGEVRSLVYHVLNSINTIEMRLEKLESSFNDSTPVINGAFVNTARRDYEQSAKSSNDTVEPQQRYRTMAEHIQQRPEGMTEDEARQDFIERCLANLDKLETVCGIECWQKWNTAYSPSFGNFDPRYRLPLDAYGKLPDYPLLRCPDVGGEPDCVWVGVSSSHIDQTDADSLNGIAGPLESTDRAARAMWNKWMRERFEVNYEEE